MQHFNSDYMEGCHPAIFQRLSEINLQKHSGYGTDGITRDAARKILSLCECKDGAVYFLSGGTQANMAVLDALLQKHEGVIAARTGHIAVHEAGAIESTGHKVIALQGHDGKLDAEEVKEYVNNFYMDSNHDHMVAPGALYITHPTEYGTLYTKAQLQKFASICKEFGMRFYLDGARLGYGLAAANTDVTLPVIAECCDAFYIGGTKIGCLFGEAVVFTNKNSVPHFFSLIKQHGALLAKGWIVATQFDILFTDGLYFKMASHANDMAAIFERALKEKGYKFFIESPTNQKFVIIENERLSALEKYMTVEHFEPQGKESTVVRFATSWATVESDVREAITHL